MTFGSESTFRIIGEILCQTDEAYEPLCKILYKDTGVLINKYCAGIQSADKEDIMQNVVWKVLRDLPRFYSHSERNTEQQRNAYLKRIVYNECMDFLEKQRNQF